MPKPNETLQAWMNIPTKVLYDEYRHKYGSYFGRLAYQVWYEVSPV